MISAVDLFCGAGGTSTGLLQAAADLGRPVRLTAINHWTRAISTHSVNHPDVRHICGRLENIRPTDVAPDRRLDLLVASPECTHHSTAAGGAPKNDQSRSQAWLINHWLSELQVGALMIENVREFQSWGPLGKNRRPLKRQRGRFFKAWIESLRAMGYQVEWRVLNAADYGDPQDRYRLIVQARRGQIHWPKPTHGPTAQRPRRAAREIIDWELKGQSIFRRRRPLCANTMRRIKAGLRKFGGAAAEPFLMMISQTGSGGDCVRSVDQPLATVCTKQEIALVEPFLVKYYGTGGAASLDQPLDTVTTRDRFMLVQPTTREPVAELDILFRMLQPHELAGAFTFPDGYQFTGNKAEQVKQIGNAVPVQLARACCRAALSQPQEQSRHERRESRGI